MTADEGHSRLLYWAGVALGPTAWAINLQAAYAAAHFACEKARLGEAILGAVLVIISLAGTAISARAVRRSAGAEWAEAQGGGPRTFLAWLGVGSGVLFALVIANQLFAALMISPCLR